MKTLHKLASKATKSLALFCENATAKKSASTATAMPNSKAKLAKSTLAASVAAFCVAVLAPTNAAALEFNELGHKATAMGGVGVAVKSNPYAIFYNPALTAANPATRFGYGLGGSFAEKNILDVFNYNFESLEDVPAFNKLLEENFIHIKAQGTLAFKIPDVLPLGQLSVGFAYTAYGTANFTGYLPDNVTSIMQGDTGLVTFNMRRVDVMEIPVSYAISSETPIGQVSVGAALKFMNAASKLSNRTLQITDNKNDIITDVKDTLTGSGATRDSNVGLDLGVVYSPVDFSGLSVALSAKNLNAPKFKFKENGELKIKPQARLGAAWELGEWVTIAGDIDLTSNELVSASDAAKVQKSQKMGLGAAFDMMFFGARAGVAKDLKQDNGAILSLGLGFGFLDLGAAVATKKSKVDGTSYPRYFALTLGGGFSF